MNRNKILDQAAEKIDALTSMSVITDAKKQIRDIIAKAHQNLCELEPAASGPWRPISEAPRDGAKFLMAYLGFDKRIRFNVVCCDMSLMEWATDSGTWIKPVMATHFSLINPPTKEGNND